MPLRRPTVFQQRNRLWNSGNTAGR